MALTMSIYNARDERQEDAAYVQILSVTEDRYYDVFTTAVVLGFFSNRAMSIGNDQFWFKIMTIGLPLDITQPRTDESYYTQIMALGDYNGVDFSTASLYVEPEA